MNLIVRNCKLKDQTGLKDVGIEGEKIVAVEDHIPVAAPHEIDARGRLTTPAFIDPHIHLDKTLIADVVRPNTSGTLREAIEIIWEKKARYTVEEIVERAGKTIMMSAQNGTTRMRTHVDVDTIGGLTPLKGLLEARERYRDIMDIEIAAFPQEGILKDPGCEDLMWEAMELGADVVGGMPANEIAPEDSRRHIEICFRIAAKFNADIDMHVDETDDPFYRTLEMLADQTVANGWQGRVTAGHTCALASYDDHYANYVIEKVKQAELHMITNPATNLMLQGRLDHQPKRRGITRVKELLEAGVNVSFGQDCVRDTFYPFGQADMLEVALITAHSAHMSLPLEVDKVFEMMTVNAARLLRLKDYGIAPGCRADIVVLDAREPGDAIRFRPDRLHVLRRGRLIAQNKTNRELLRQ